MDEATRLMPRFYLGSAPSHQARFTYIALCAAEYQPESLGLALLQRIPLHDDETEIDEAVEEYLWNNAKKIAAAWTSGHRVLVSCIAGRNRSALMATLAISIVSGQSPKFVAQQVRKARIDELGVHALQNPVFWQFLQDYS